MKNLITIVTLACSLAACKKENTPTKPADEMVDTTSAMEQKAGNFINGPYGSVSGTAKLYKENNVYTLVFENVKISNGPDLHVYLSKEVQPINFIDLGKLKSTSGNQVYAISGMPDFTQYKYALVHCQQFNHLFGSAELK
jgi:hypothetical protein